MTNFTVNPFVKKWEGRMDYNYQLEPLIEEFNKNGFYTLIDHSKENSQDNGAYLTITGKQYVLALNEKYGTGTHSVAAARIFGDLTGNTLTDDKNVLYMSFLSENIPSTFFARIYYEYQHDNDNGRPIFGGNIEFPLGNKKFNSNEIKMFLKFYNDYNSQISSICKNYTFHVSLKYRNENNEIVRIESDNLDEVKAYILKNKDDTIVDYFEENNISEKIIGTTIKGDTFKL